MKLQCFSKYLHKKLQVHILALRRCALSLLVAAPGLQIDTLQFISTKSPEKMHPKTLIQISHYNFQHTTAATITSI